jgi:hypothetical protein
MNKRVLLVNYVRGDNRVPVATIVGLSDGSIGLAICSGRDRFVKARGRYIATHRALLGVVPNMPNGTIVKDGRDQPLNEVLWSEMFRMKGRAWRYFKEDMVEA